SENLPEGYLFLCPMEDLRNNDGRWLPNPEFPAYWSLDPSGSRTLTPEETSKLGFPSLNLAMNVWARSWNESVYTAVGHFHAGKGFDLNSQDVAQYLGNPLYKL
ncbi:hypothetical protein C8R44DRAFT_564427, partial [Mycena epipterygia]